MTMRWRRNPRETGLRAVGAGERGYQLFRDGESIASVNAFHWRDSRKGWYWVVGSPLPYMNTCNKPVATGEEAKTAAMQYVRDHMTDSIPERDGVTT